MWLPTFMRPLLCRIGRRTDIQEVKTFQDTPGSSTPQALSSAFARTSTVLALLRLWGRHVLSACISISLVIGHRTLVLMKIHRAGAPRWDRCGI